MKKLIPITLLILGLSVKLACADSGFGGPKLNVESADAAVSLYADKMVFPTGTVADDGAGTATITLSGASAPADADYLVGTANGSLSAEIVVGTSPGGELGGTWASPTIDDSLAVTSWNLTTPTLTTSATVTDAFTLGLGSGKGLIQFDDETTDFVSFSNCNVGIGTTAPATKLDVSGGIRTNDSYVSTNTRTDAPVVANGDYQGSNGYWGLRTSLTGNNLNVDVHNGGSPLAAITVLSVGGNVGIGTTAPDKALEINSATGADLRLTYNDSNGTATYYADFSVSSAGLLNILPSGNAITLGGGTTATDLRFLEPSASGTNYSAFKAVAQGADITYSLPPTVGGAGTQLTDVAGDGVLTWAAAGGSGDITSVGDCTTGACFDGTQGTTLTFYDAGGNQTIKYNESGDVDFNFSNDININDVTPHLRLTDTTASEDDFEMYADAGMFYLTNVTDSIVLAKANANRFQHNGVQTKTIAITNPTASADGAIWRTPNGITILAVHVLCTGGTNIVGQLYEYDNNGANGATVDSSDITGLAGVNANDDGTLSNPSIDANDYVGWNTTSVSGSPTRVVITFDYQEVVN